MKTTALKIITPEPEETKEPGRKPFPVLKAPYFADALIDCSEPRYLKQTMAELKKKRNQPAKFKNEPTLADKIRGWFK